MIVVTGAFAFTDILPVRQMGLGVALAIFLDATIIRLMLVPSLMKLFGDWNWWLPFRKKRKIIIKILIYKMSIFMNSKTYILQIVCDKNITYK